MSDRRARVQALALAITAMDTSAGAWAEVSQDAGSELSTLRRGSAEWSALLDATARMATAVSAMRAALIDCPAADEPNAGGRS